MSAADDVLETKTLFEFLAERLAPKADDKAATGILHKELRVEKDKPLFTWNRVYDLLKGRARRVDGWEKDFARERVAALQKEEVDAHARREEGYRVVEARIATLEAIIAELNERVAGRSLAEEGHTLHRSGEGVFGRRAGDRADQ